MSDEHETQQLCSVNRHISYEKTLRQNLNIAIIFEFADFILEIPSWRGYSEIRFCVFKYNQIYKARWKKPVH